MVLFYDHITHKWVGFSSQKCLITKGHQPIFHYYTIHIPSLYSHGTTISLLVNPTCSQTFRKKITSIKYPWVVANFANVYFLNILKQKKKTLNTHHKHSHVPSIYDWFSHETRLKITIYVFPLIFPRKNHFPFKNHPQFSTPSRLSPPRSALRAGPGATAGRPSHRPREADGAPGEGRAEGKFTILQGGAP